MVGRYLVTTADERTWPTDQPVLFLGEWCRLYDRKAVWEKLDAEVVPYHWDDREKLYRDYNHMQGVYEELLRELAEKLNEVHDVDHSLRYWRILIGPWLGYFVQMLFDRWAMIERAVSQFDIAGVRVMQTSLYRIIPNDMAHFQRLFVTDEWNEAIYGHLLKGCTNNVVVEELPRQQQQNCELTPDPNLEQPLRVGRQLKRGLARIASWVSQGFASESEAFFISSYLPIKEDLRLQWELGQIPKIWRSFSTPSAAMEESKRQWRLGEFGQAGFAGIIRAMIPNHIPTSYLEGYGALHAYCDGLPWPKKPRLVFTSNSYGSNDVFKAWAAAKVENGASLIIGQHGGGYGVALWGFTEDHQIAISDAWISWGWDQPNSSRIKPCANLKAVLGAQDWAPKGHGLLVGMAIPRYSYHMYSVPVASQWLDYFEDQCRFTIALPEKVRRLLLVRLYIHDYGWCQKQRWQDRFPDVRLDDGTAPMASLIEKSRLYISTYNATTYLESLFLNVPTIMFWNPNHWELRDDARPYFNRLKEVGIFHETPESAAAKVAEIWDDVPGWWSQPEIQEVRAYFCHRFSRTVDNPVEVLKETFNAVSPS